MPSALETLVKILKLEREQGCENRAVIGGLTNYSVTWKDQAQQQARRPEHVLLADEIADILGGYDNVDNKIERLRQINYILDRIVGRQPAPAEYKQKLDEAKQQVKENKQQSRQRPEQAPREQRDRRSNKRDKKQSSSGGSSKASNRASTPPPPPDAAGIMFDEEDIVAIAPGELDIKPHPKLARPPRSNKRRPSTEEAMQMEQALDQPVTAIKGIGESIAATLSQLGINTVRDMVYYLPRRFDDYTEMKYISKLSPGETATLIATVKHTEVRIAAGGRKDFVIRVEDGSGSLAVFFFGQHFLARSIRVGHQIVLSGKLGIWRNTLQMANPQWEPLDSDNLHTVGIVPVYGLTEGLKARSFRRTMKRTVDQWAERVPDFIPRPILERAELAELDWAIQNLHFPEGWDHLDHARRRYAFNQLIVLQLAMLGNRYEWQSIPGQALTITDEFLESFIQQVFPYELTSAQRRAIEDIRKDVSQTLPMNRLIQGDVGSGKTAVALVALSMALANGKQAALMAPTSILAEQHYRGITASLANLETEQRPVIALLTGALTNSERESIYRGMADGSIDIVIGTHALIQEGVTFNDLAVAVVDEQHRFGVEQRGALRGKGTNPHLLVMTATPIPRTLALTMHADLDLTIIDEKPPGRQPITTRVMLPLERERAFSFIEAQLNEGRQAFVIHPLVEASERIEARSAVEAFEELQQVFHRYRVCLLHGRMSPAEKDEIMGAFARHEYDVMVTTSVAEVGVDIPNASVIMIEGANRFGLAQLHQFRGRVGRGQHQSFCLLIPDSDSDEALQRLEILQSTDDGFELAEADWRLRGAGDLLGTRQSGAQFLQLMNTMDPELVELAQREARTVFAEDPLLQSDEYRLLAGRVNALINESGDIS